MGLIASAPGEDRMHLQLDVVAVLLDLEEVERVFGKGSSLQCSGCDGPGSCLLGGLML